MYIDALVNLLQSIVLFITCRRREFPRRRNRCRVRKPISLRQNSLKPPTALLLYGDDDASTTFGCVSNQNHIRIFFYLSIPRKPRKKESHQRATIPERRPPRPRPRLSPGVNPKPPVIFFFQIQKKIRLIPMKSLETNVGRSLAREVVALYLLSKLEEER